MNLILEVRLEDALSARTRDFRRNVSRPYPGVPSAGDVLDFGDIDRQMPRRVSEAIYLAVGDVIIRTLSNNVDNDPVPQIDALLQLGYAEIGLD